MYAAIELTGIGGDAFFLALVIVFFGLCVALVRACEAIMGPDPVELREGGGLLDEPVPASASVSVSVSVSVSDAAPVPGERVGVLAMKSYDNVVALVISVGILAYLVYALVFPEKL